MEFVQLALCLSAFVTCVFSGGAPLSFEGNSDAPILVAVDAKSFTLAWESDSETFPEYTKFEVKHQNSATMAERVIGKLDGTTPSEVASGYSLNVTMPESGSYKKFILTIDSVEFQDDGVFMATVISNVDSDSREVVAVNVTVVKKLTSLHLEFNEQQPISSKPEDAVEVEAGSYPVSCIAEGSNPATTDVSLHLDGNAVALKGVPKVDQMEGEVKEYKTTIMADVELEERSAVFSLECVATDPSGETLTTQLDVKVLVPEREDVSCDETKAKEGDMSVTLVCTVDHTNMNVTSLAFQIGETGQIIESGQEAGNDSVVVSTTTPGKSTVTLTLDKAEDWHFESDFYLIITTSDGNVRKETVTLEKTGSDGGNGNCPSASLGWILFMVFSVLLSRQ